MLERHIMQAQARAMSADERSLNKSASSLHGFPDLGLPPGKLVLYDMMIPSLLLIQYILYISVLPHLQFCLPVCTVLCIHPAQLADLVNHDRIW